MVDFYNLSAVVTNETKTLLDFTVNVDRGILGGYWIGLFILIIIFSVFFFAVKGKGYPTAQSFAVSCWMCSIAAILLKGMDLLNDFQWYGALMLTPIAIFVLWIATSGD
jgi:hypothetical protein